MRWIRGRTWLPYAMAGGLLAVVVAGVMMWLSAGRAQQRADNLKQLDRGCAGLLPQEQLRDFVPDDEAGVLEEYGTMLDPDQESRALLHCALFWGEGRWEPDTQVRVRAEALVTAQVKKEDADDRAVDDFPLPLPPGVSGSTSGDDRIKSSGVSARLRVECPGGLRGRSGPSKALSVRVELPSRSDGAYDVPAADHLLAARTAVAAANWVTERQDCGREPIRTDASPRPAAGATPTKLCAWIDPVEMEFATDAWEFSGDDTYNRRYGYCDGNITGYGAPPGLPVVGMRAESWSGEFAQGAYERHARAGTAPGQRAPSPAAPDGSVVIKTSEFSSPKLALWAESVCDGGRSYHRIALTPAFESGEKKKIKVEGEVRKRLSTDARATLDRYLAAADGWPQRARCHGTKILGEVEEWPR
ncbi:hypothetical protein [Streptomyces sp. cmx-18-6]|uniref:hypothetical protein n=1 Tax=Streptomyces sp. cmx-18-6 TaxID=2790930 RepID=UPI003980AB8F